MPSFSEKIPKEALINSKKTLSSGGLKNRLASVSSRTGFQVVGLPAASTGFASGKKAPAGCPGLSVCILLKSLISP